MIAPSTAKARQPHFLADIAAKLDVDFEAEQAVLGSVLIDKRALDRIGPDLKPEHFYLPANQKIYAVMVALWAKRVPPDIITVSNELEHRGQSGEAPPSYLASLAIIVPTALNAEYYGRIVRREARQRRIAWAKARVGDAPPDAPNLPELLNDLRDAMVDDQDAETFSSLAEGLTELNDEIDLKRAGVEIGLRSGFTDIDALTGPWGAGDITILAALTGAGKTAWSVNVTYFVTQQGIRVAFFSMEMNQKQIALRLASLASGIPATLIRDATMTDEQMALYAQVQGPLAALPLRLDAKHIPSVAEMRRQLLIEHRLWPFGLVVVDLLGSVRGEGNENRTQEVSQITNGLKALAVELQLPILACQQLSRQANDRREIQIDMIKDSSTVEQVATNVLLLTPPDRAGPVEQRNIARIKVAKSRHGERGPVSLYFHWPTLRFSNLDGRQGDGTIDYGSVTR